MKLVGRENFEVLRDWKHCDERSKEQVERGVRQKELESKDRDCVTIKIRK